MTSHLVQSAAGGLVESCDYCKEEIYTCCPWHGVRLCTSHIDRCPLCIAESEWQGSSGSSSPSCSGGSRSGKYKQARPTFHWRWKMKRMHRLQKKRRKNPDIDHLLKCKQEEIDKLRVKLVVARGRLAEMRRRLSDRPGFEVHRSDISSESDVSASSDCEVESLVLVEDASDSEAVSSDSWAPSLHGHRGLPLSSEHGVAQLRGNVGLGLHGHRGLPLPAEHYVDQVHSGVDAGLRGHRLHKDARVGSDSSSSATCDKCDGKHPTDQCPHYRKDHERHNDAWVGGDSSSSTTCDKCDGKHPTDQCPHYRKDHERHNDAWVGSDSSSSATCDKCDGKHPTDQCPHYRKDRESHEDAWVNHSLGVKDS